MNRFHARTLALVVATGMVGGTAGAAPPTPSTVAIEAAIAGVRSAWGDPQGDDQRRAAGWGAFAEAVEGALGDYTGAADEAARRRALDRLVRLADALRVSAWGPAVGLRQALDDWLAPRLSLADASRRLEETIRSLPPAPGPEFEANRQRWLQLDDRLGAALRAYEGAGDVAARVQALADLRAELATLQTVRQSTPWAPALSLHEALARLFDRPNVEAVADLSIVSPELNQQVVRPDVIYRQGQVSYVTPGPKTGFGLLPNDQGISFYNSQIAYSYTPVRGFQEQIAADERGRRAARLYRFDATTYNTSEATVYTHITTRGIDIVPTATNNVDAAISATNQPGHGPHVTRSIASLVGFDRERVRREVYEGAIPQIREQAEIGSREEAAEKSAQAEAQLNAQAARFLIGNDTIALGEIALARTQLASQPSYVLAQGLLTYRNVPTPVGAEFAQPPEFQAPAPGLSADVHLPSALSNLSQGYFASAQAQEVRNLLIESIPGQPPVTTRNADFATFLEAIDRARESGQEGAQAIRIWRPSEAPEYASDSEGNLVVLVRDFRLEVANPRPSTGQGLFAGPRARVFRINAPRAVFTLDFSVDPPAGPGQPLRIRGRVVSFDPGPGARVIGLTDSEEAEEALNPVVAAGILATLRNRLADQAIDQAIDQLQLQGFSIQSVSDMHPTGWLRAVLTRNP